MDALEPHKWRCAGQAFAILVFFFAVLFLGVGPHSPSRPAPTAVEFSLIPLPKLPPPPKAAKQAEKPPEKKTEKKADKKPPRPKINEADIARKKAEEKKRKKAEEEKRKKDEARRKKAAAEKERERLAEKEAEKKAAAERKRRAEELATRAARREELSSLRDSYIGRIQQKVNGCVGGGDDLPSDVEVVVSVRLTDEGDLVGIPGISQPSGYPEYDEQAIRGILRCGQLPMPKEQELLEQFRRLDLRISPE